MVLIWVWRRASGNQWSPWDCRYLFCVGIFVPVSGKRCHCFHYIPKWVWDPECMRDLAHSKKLQVLGQRFSNFSEHQSHAGSLSKCKCIWYIWTLQTRNLHFCEHLFSGMSYSEYPLSFLMTLDPVVTSQLYCNNSFERDPSIFHSSHQKCPWTSGLYSIEKGGPENQDKSKGISTSSL